MSVSWDSVPIWRSAAVLKTSRCMFETLRLALAHTAALRKVGISHNVSR